MKTKLIMPYSELFGGKPYDWNAFFEKTHYLKSELSEATYYANSWTTCACGNLCALIPRDELSAPVDTKLRELGMKFISYIAYMKESTNSQNRDHWKYYAKSTLNRIEIRSTELLETILTETE